MNDDRGGRLVWWIAAAILVGLVAYRFVPRLENPLTPTPHAAFVAILADGEKVARDGAHDLEAGRSFRLYAVLAAKSWSGAPIWYTDAPALELRGEAIPDEQLRPWPGEKLVHVRWFTIEPNVPFLRVAQTGDFDRLVLREEFHPEWGDGWSVPGVIDPRLVRLPSESPLRPLRFGVQRYEVRVELFSDPTALIPSQRFVSAGPERFLAGEAFATSAAAHEPGALEVLTRSFGRTEAELVEPTDPGATQRLDELRDRGLVFVATQLLAEHIAANGRRPQELRWRGVVVGRDDMRWGRDVAAGDLLQGGGRIVALFADQGEPGRLDARDLVIDLDAGLHLRRLDEIFTATDGLDLSFSSLMH